MRQVFWVLALGAVLSGCAGIEAGPEVDVALPPDALRPEARPEGLSAPPPPPAARTAEEFDTTTEAQRAEAAATVAAGERRLGLTIASLGDPAEPGFWLVTPLVGAVQTGRVALPGAGGASVAVELRPSGGPPGSGSRISLAALRVLGVPLTSLPEVAVFAG